MKKIIPTLVIVFLFSCNYNRQKQTNPVLQSSKAGTIHADSFFLKETFQNEDTVYNEYLADKLKPIRENFKRINSILKWTSLFKKEIDESTEGGEAKFYYTKGNLEKIVTRNFGETFQQLTEYYLLNRQLSFVFEKSLVYNRPIYYDSTSMEDNNDNEAFDSEKSKIIEDRSYFEKGKLIHQVNNQDCGSPFAEDYLIEEQQRLIGAFEKLKALAKER